MNTPPSPPAVRGWWRRNLWGLLALPLLLVGVLAINADGFYDRNVKLVPRQPIAAAVDEPVEYGGARLLLESIEQVEPTEELVGYRKTLTPGLAIWRCVVTVEAAPDNTISAAEMQLEDAEGRRYGSGPSELDGSAALFTGLGPDTFDEPRPNPYTATRYYVLPATSRPVAVRIVYNPELPRYVRFALS